MKTKTTLISPFVALIIPVVFLMGAATLSGQEVDPGSKNKANACLQTFALKRCIESKFSLISAEKCSQILEKVFR